MLKIGQNWGKIANYLPPHAQQKFAPLVVYEYAIVRFFILFSFANTFRAFSGIKLFF